MDGSSKAQVIWVGQFLITIQEGAIEMGITVGDGGRETSILAILEDLAHEALISRGKGPRRGQVRLGVREKDEGNTETRAWVNFHRGRGD
jgi:hypothetical protein